MARAATQWSIPAREDDIQMNRKLICVDLFCGAGGLSRGFLDAGYDVVLGVDVDDAALETFRRNHGNTYAMKLDLYDRGNIE